MTGEVAGSHRPRLVLFGATGGTGRELVRQAIEAAIDVTALVRRADALTTEQGRITVVLGDVLHVDTLDGLIRPGDAVVSTLGIGHSAAATTVYSVGTGNVLRAMRLAGARRFVCLSTCALEVSPAGTVAQRLFTRAVLQPMLRRPYADMRAMEAAVKASDLDWTIVRAARLTNGQRRGDLRVGPAGTLRAAWSVSRADLAAHLLRVVHRVESFRQVEEVAY